MGRRKQICYTEKRFFSWFEDDCAVSLRNKSGSYGGGSEVFVLAENDIKSLPDYIVRRLTPMECERLQAYPDGWCDIPPFEVTDKRGKKKLKKVTDSDKYKALGNSIATCAWTDIMQSIAERCGERTLGSLFDGIGGFPLIWERDCGGKAVWASEIEPYCIAVTEYRFPENGNSKLCSQNRNVERERERERESRLAPTKRAQS